MIASDRIGEGGICGLGPWSLIELSPCFTACWVNEDVIRAIWIVPHVSLSLAPSCGCTSWPREMPGRSPGSIPSIPCSLLLEWEQSMWSPRPPAWSQAWQGGPGPPGNGVNDGRGPAQPEHCSHSVLVFSRDDTGIPIGFPMPLPFRSSFQHHHSTIALGSGFALGLGGRQGAEVSQGLCQILHAPSEQLRLIWVFLHSHAVQSQVLISDYRACSWVCLQCREHVLKLLKHSSLRTQTFFCIKWKSWVQWSFPGPSALPHFYRLKSL